MNYKDFPRPLSERTEEDDEKRITEFSLEMLKKWQKGRKEHGVVIKIDPLEEAMKECVDIANYALETYYRIDQMRKYLNRAVKENLNADKSGN